MVENQSELSSHQQQELTLLFNRPLFVPVKIIEIIGTKMVHKLKNKVDTPLMFLLFQKYTVNF